MLRRVEVAWPIHDAVIQKRIIDDILTPYLEDNVDAWVLGEGGDYKAVRMLPQNTGQKPISSQAQLMKKHSS
jgi:polyphosphate kinase